MSVMEKERPQSISGSEQGGGEDSTNSPTNCKSSESQDDNVAETEPEPESELEPEPTPELAPETETENTMANLSLGTQCRTIEHLPKMKLIVRSQYWGRELKGRTCRNVYTNMNNKAPLVITTQAVLYNTDNTDGFWGCCPNHGKRVLELQEYHFSDASEGCHWDLYLVGTWVSPQQSIHDFFLLPQNQTSVDIERNVRLNGWSFFGTCNMDMIRSGMDDLLRGLLLQNDAYGHRYHHVHVDIMMDKAFDRETPRSRKINNEKARAERKKNLDSASQSYDRQESSVTTDATESTEQESQPPPANTVENTNRPIATKVVGASPPPIPLYINDGSYLAQVPHSMATPMVGYQGARWAGETTLWNHDQYTVASHPGLVVDRSGQIASGGSHQGSRWYPARGVQQQPSYWQHGNGTQFATAPPQPYYHLPDMQVQQYPVGVQYTPLPSELQHFSVPMSENTYYTGMNGSPERPFTADPSMIFREGHEGSNIGSLPHSLHNVSTSDCSVSPPSPPVLGSSPPDMPTDSLAPAEILDTAKVSPIAATNAPSIVSSNHSGVSPQASSTLLDTTGRVPPSTTASNTQLGAIPTPSRLLIPGEEES